MESVYRIMGTDLHLKACASWFMIHVLLWNTIWSWSKSSKQNVF